MEKAVCNNCHSLDYEIIFKEGEAQYQQIVKCKNCGLMYVYPLKIENNEKYWEGKTKEQAVLDKKAFFSDKMKYMIDQKEKLQIKDFSKSIKYVEKVLPDKGNVLEVGPSRGYFLHELEVRGWKVYGVEPAKARRDEAKRIFGYDFVPDKLEDTNLPESSFDVIFLFHVIEHILQPSEFINMLYKYLKPGGILVMETPTYDTATFKILRNKERSIRCDGHFYFFTKKTLKSIVCKNNMKILRHDRVGRSLSMERLCWNFTVMFKSKFLEKILFKLSSALAFNKLNIYINAGDMQRIYCQKPDSSNMNNI